MPPPPRPTSPRLTMTLTLAGHLPCRLVLRLTASQAAQAGRLGCGGKDGGQPTLWQRLKRWF